MPRDTARHATSPCLSDRSREGRAAAFVSAARPAPLELRGRAARDSLVRRPTTSWTPPPNCPGLDDVGGRGQLVPAPGRAIKPQGRGGVGCRYPETVRARYLCSIHDVSQGSKYYENERRRHEAVTRRIDRMLERRSAALDRLGSVERARAESHVSRVVAELEAQRDVSRIILHCDMDMFYAAVEVQRCPELRGKRFAVGHGVLLTASYEARQRGVRSAMAEYVARALCPDLLVVETHFDAYRRRSEQVMSVLRTYDPTLHQRSLDEAYLDVTSYCATHAMDPRDVAAQLRLDVYQATEGLTVSVGIACNRLLAKIASDHGKPDGVWYVPPTRDDMIAFMRGLSVRKVPGIGQVTERMLSAISIHTCDDIWARRVELSVCIDSYRMLLAAALGISDTHIAPPSRDARRSVGCERTLAPTTDPATLHAHLRTTCENLSRDLVQQAYRARTVTLVCKRDTFERFTRARACRVAVYTSDDLYAVVHALLEQERAASPVPLCLRLVGVRASSLIDMHTARDGPLAQWLKTPPTASRDPVVCPVCSKDIQVRGVRTASINAHIDACLSRASRT